MQTDEKLCGAIITENAAGEPVTTCQLLEGHGGQCQPLPYEKPTLVPLGNLYSLLAGGGSNCDAGVQGGFETPRGTC